MTCGNKHEEYVTKKVSAKVEQKDSDRQIIGGGAGGRLISLWLGLPGHHLAMQLEPTAENKRFKLHIRQMMESHSTLMALKDCTSFDLHL